jgi:NADH-quinone oxidoreductase subunit H
VIADATVLLAKVVGAFAVLMVMVLATVYVERKVVSWMQTRVGPNRVGPFGLLQSLADGIKLFFKEDVRPSGADRILYLVAPVAITIPAFLSITVVPFGTSFGSEAAQLTDLDVGLLFVLAMAGLQVYGIVLAGYASGSNYPLLGGIRSSAQMISYEIAQGLSLVGVFMYAGTLSARGIVQAQQDPLELNFLPGWLDLPGWFVIPQLPMFVIFVIAGLAETNRAPFDLPEAETELVGGYHTEYSGIRFALFFLAEYLNMITVSAVATTVFLGGPDGPVFGFLPSLWPVLWFLLKVCALLFLFIWVRATMPRFRFDALMALGWKVLLPVALLWIAVTGVILTVDLAGIRTWLFAAAGALVALLVVLTVIGPAAGRGRRVATEETAS